MAPIGRFSSFPQALDFYNTDPSLVNNYLDGIYNTVIFKDVILRKGYRVCIGKIAQYEVDFVAQNSEGIEYYQFALTTRDTSVLQRELLPLQKINDSNPKFLITLADDLPALYDGIKKINAIDFLLK